ncbi:molybdenum cofactor biosynthesis protein MoaE [Desulfovibrio litoralis]|uniref:Molybdopterin synthase catalytic subunit n=1 Tax=Desulfovibrio litoralis DSM 11393 TaxID=1121455 RepID=A0A1M7SRL4_9BACT|nr:molybdenum cofactor biosynthesis protein MoaE [Desulfovibrio litoralis]SHN61020.1 Molybdopterin synthase catalytic subunit [Desulfovibrio litoralis DSM 11393]
MDINQAIANLKKEPGFTDKVGMVMVHNGVIRGSSRKDGSKVSSLVITVDYNKIEEIRQELEKRQGIFRILAHAYEGELKPGDDALILVVAGDFRENVKAVFSELLDRIKSEAVVKQEKLA